MKIMKLVVGIITILFALVFMFQSCAANLGEKIFPEGSTVGESSMQVATIFMVIGIAAIVSRENRWASILSAVGYLAVGVASLAAIGIFHDLKFLGVISLVLAFLFFTSIFTMPRNY